MSFTLLDTQKVLLTVAGQDAAGNAAPLDLTNHPLSATSSNDAVATVAPGTDPSTFEVVSAGLGTATITVLGGGLDSNGQQLQGTFDVEVDASGAVRLVITPGTPEAK